MMILKRQWLFIKIALAWLPLGLLFQAHTVNFDWGFLPYLIWLFTVIVLSPGSFIVVCFHIIRYSRERLPLLLAWIGLFIGYSAALALSWG